METRGEISEGLPQKGKFESSCIFPPNAANNFTNSFGWVNASYQIGLDIISSHMQRALGACIPPDAFFRMTDTEVEGLVQSVEGLGI